MNEAHFVASLQGYINAGIGFVLGAFDGQTILGSIGGLVFPDFATGQPTCMEFYWYMLPAHRGMAGIRLLKAFEAEADRRQAVRIVMMHITGQHTAGFTRLYEQSGYRLIEQVFSKELHGRTGSNQAAA